MTRLPKVGREENTIDITAVVGTSFAEDIIKRERQLILVVREIVTSFSSTTLIADERAVTRRVALVSILIRLSSLDGPLFVLRTDAGPGFMAPRTDAQISVTA